MPAHYPEAAVNELIYVALAWGETDFVDPVTKYIFEGGFSGYSYGFGQTHESYVWTTFEKTIIEKAKKDPMVKSRMIDIERNWPTRVYHWVNNDTRILQNLISKLPANKAMTAVANGGIDLENINVQSKGMGNVKTAFDDQAQLAILIRADGLIPVIENVKPLTQSAISLLLGSI